MFLCFRVYESFANSAITLVRETAERAKAEELLRQVQEYEDKNPDYIQRVRAHVSST